MISRRGIVFAAVALLLAAIAFPSSQLGVASRLKEGVGPSSGSSSQPAASPTKPAPLVPPPPVAPPFEATAFISDVVIPSKRAIQVVGWSPDGSRLAYTSLDVALNLPRGLEQLYSSDLSGTVVTDEGPMARPSLVQPNTFNPQRGPAAAWAKDGTLVRETTAGAVATISTNTGAQAPALPLYSIPVDRNGNFYLLGADDTWKRDDGATIAQFAGPVDEGAFSVSPDGKLATYAQDRPDGQRDLVLAEATGGQKVVATAPFVAVDGWKADSSAFVLRTGSTQRSSWMTDVAWFVFSSNEKSPVAEGLPGPGFVSMVVPSLVDANTYLVGAVPFGTGTAPLAAWYLTTDAGLSFSRFGLGATGNSAWSPDGSAIAYITDVKFDGTGDRELHIARLR